MKTLNFNEMVEVQGGGAKEDYAACVIVTTTMGSYWGWFGAVIGFALGATFC